MPSARQYAAFTLIELLVVISIVALLIAILLPSLAAARAAGRNVQCLSSHRQFGVAIRLYGADNKSYAVPSGMFNANSGGPVMPGYAAWQSPKVSDALFLGQYTDRKASSSAPTGAVPAGGGIWKCGEDDTGDLSYGMINRSSSVGAGLFFPFINNTAAWSTRMKRIDDAKMPSKLLTIIDAADGRVSVLNSLTNPKMYGNAGDNDGSSWSNDAINSYYNHNMWHAPGNNASARGTNIGFLDGHAKTVVNERSDINGFYWLNPLVGVEFDIVQN